MLSDLTFLTILMYLGITDFRHRKIKHWHFFTLASFILGHLFISKHLNTFVFLNFLGVLFIGWLAFLDGKVGAADVRIIAVSSLYNFYSINTWWVAISIGLMIVCDLTLWLFYFQHRDKTSPLLFSWMGAVAVLYLSALFFL